MGGETSSVQFFKELLSVALKKKRKRKESFSFLLERT